MSKTTSRTAETSLSIRGVVDLDYPKTEGADGDGEVTIRVRRQGSGLRITVSMIVAIDGNEDDAIMELAANIQPDDFRDLLGFEKTIRAMGPCDPEITVSEPDHAARSDAHFLRVVAATEPTSRRNRLRAIADRISTEPPLSGNDG